MKTRQNYPADRNNTRVWRRYAAVGLLLAAALVGMAFSQADEKTHIALRGRVYKLRHITSQQFQAILEQLSIGKEYNALASDVLLVSSDKPADLVKATSVAAAADTKDGAEVRAVMELAADQPAPKAELIAAMAKNATVGTLLQGPPIGSPKPGIVDVVGQKLVALGGADALAAIEQAVAEWQKQNAPAKPAPQPETSPAPQPDDAAPTEPAPQAETPATPAAPAPQEPAVVDKADLPTEEFLAAELVEELEQERQASPAPSAPEAIEAAAPPSDTPSADAAAPTDDADAQGQAELQAALRKLLAPKPDQAAEPTEPTTGGDAAEKPSPKPQPKKNAAKPSDSGQTVAIDQQLADEELELTLTLPEEVELEALIELVGKTLKLNYLYDPATVRGQKVTVRVHDGRIKVRDIYALLESALRFRGFVMTRRGNLVTIARREEGMVDPALRSPDEPIQPGDVVVSNVFHLHHITPAAAQNLLTQMKLGAEFSSVAETGTLIVTDYAFRMERIRQVIGMLDQPGTLKTFQYRQLRYMQASELAPKVQALAQQLQNLTVSVAAAQPTATRIDPRTRQPVPVQPGQPPQPAPPQPMPAAAGDSGRPTAYLEADERTNRVLMIATPSDMKVLNELIDSLDVPGYNLRTVKEYVIQNVEATEVISVLNQLGIAQVSLTGQDMLYGMYGTRGAAMRQQVVQPGQPPQPMPQPMPTTAAGAETTNINQPFIALRQATNSLLVNATQEQHKAIEMVIQFVDVKQKDQRTIREYEIQHVDTQTILDTLAELGIISKRRTEKDSAAGGMMGMAGRNLTPQQQQMMLMQQQQMMAETGEMTFTLPTAEGTEREITAAQPQIAVLPTTNSLLVHATPRQHQAIALVIAHADRQLEQIATPYMVYPLENQDAEKLAEVLNTLIKETIDEKLGATQASAPDAKVQTKPTGGLITLPSGEEQRVRIIADKDSRSIIVYANRRNQQWIAELIRKLDEYRPQVLLDVTLVNITRDDEFKFDLEMVSRKDGFAPGGTGMTKLTPLVTPFPAGTVLEGQSTYSNMSAFYSDQHIQALLKLFDKKNYGRVLAKPSILVKDNQEGVIKAENVIYVAEPKSNIITGEGGQLSKTADVTFKDYTAGLTLTITPHIASEKLLQLKIELDRKDFAAGEDRTLTIDGTTYTYPKNTTSSNISTWSILPDGATIILGGIESLNQGKTVNKTPILGDLPLVGLLFRGINEKDVQSRLYVFVKANIIRPGDELTGKSDIERISQRKRKAFEELESNFQNLQALPGVKPNPIPPEKALEDDEYIEELRRKLDELDKPVTVEIR